METNYYLNNSLVSGFVNEIFITSDVDTLGYLEDNYFKNDLSGKIKIDEKIYMFVGYFDYRKTNWIYGNGVLYYRDLEGKPSRFVKGFFSCLNKTGEYKGDFDFFSGIWTFFRVCIRT